MGRYFNPATKQGIESAGGRAIHGLYHGGLVAQLKPGECLAMFLDRFTFRQIADVTDPREFEEFDSQVRSGRVLLLGYFAIPCQRFEW